MHKRENKFYNWFVLTARNAVLFKADDDPREWVVNGAVHGLHADP